MLNISILDLNFKELRSMQTTDNARVPDLTRGVMSERYVSFCVIECVSQISLEVEMSYQKARVKRKTKTGSEADTR